MPDWQELLRQRLSGLALDAAEKEEVYAEVAAHLEESYEALLKEGVTEQAAVQHALMLTGDWRELRRKIQMARQKENTMTPRTSQLWLPSLVTLLVSMTMLPALERLGLNPHFLFLRGPRGQEHALPVYTIWLLLLPFVGALGAYLSSRAGGTRPRIIVAGIFPALAFFAILLFVLPFMGFLEHGLEVNARSVFHSLTDEPFGRLGVIAGWVLVPGACLFIGVAGYLLIRRQQAARSVASL